MLIVDNTLIKIYPEDVIDGVFITPDVVLYVGDSIELDSVEKIILPNVISVGDDFLFYNKSLKHLYIPKVEKIGSSFLFTNGVITEIIMPSIKEIGFNFLACNNSIESIDMPNIEKISNSFLFGNDKFKYTNRIISSLIGRMVVGGEVVQKSEYIRKLNVKKLLC